jgi:hypothetical protein
LTAIRQLSTLILVNYRVIPLFAPLRMPRASE